MRRCLSVRSIVGSLDCARPLWSPSSGQVRGGGLRVLHDVVQDCSALRRRKSVLTQSREVVTVVQQCHLSARLSIRATTSSVMEAHLFENLIES
jgi:hypothetical protein